MVSSQRKHHQEEFTYTCWALNFHPLPLWRWSPALLTANNTPATLAPTPYQLTCPGQCSPHLLFHPEPQKGELLSRMLYAQHKMASGVRPGRAARRGGRWTTHWALSLSLSSPRVLLYTRLEPMAATPLPEPPGDSGKKQGPVGQLRWWRQDAMSAVSCRDTFPGRNYTFNIRTGPTKHWPKYLRKVCDGYFGGCALGIGSTLIIIHAFLVR